MSEQQYRGTLASGGTFVADSQGIRIQDPAGNQLASFGRDVIGGISRDGQVVTIERVGDTIVTLTTASITDAVGLEQFVRDTIVSPPVVEEAPVEPPAPPPPLAFDAFDEDDAPEAPAESAPAPPPAEEPPAPRPPIISRADEDSAERAPHDLPEPVPTTPQRSTDAPAPPIPPSASATRDTTPIAPLPPSQPPPSSYSPTTPAAPPPPPGVVAAEEEEGGGRRLWLWGCLGCGGLVILSIICIAILLATGAIDPDDFTEDDATPTPFIIIATEPEGEATPTDGESGSTDPTATPATNGEPTATTDGGGEATATSDEGGDSPTQPPAEGVMSAGETGSLGGLDLTYLSSRTDTGGLLPPDEGNEYLILAFRIENTTADPVTVSTLLQFTLTDQAGEEMPVALFADFETGLDGEIAAGDTLEGEVAFEVPAGSSNYTVAFTEAFSDEALMWAV